MERKQRERERLKAIERGENGEETVNGEGEGGKEGGGGIIYFHLSHMTEFLVEQFRFTPASFHVF